MIIIINIIKQACSCPPSPFGLALWQARGTRFATNLWAAWKPTSNSVSFPFPPSHHYTTTTCTACMLALLLAAIINHDHQGDKMLRRFTAKAGAMARRGSTLPGPGKGRVLRGGFSSTAHTGPGTSSGEELGKKWATIFQGIGAVLGVAGATAVVVRTFDQTEMAPEIKYAEVERFKREVQLAFTQDYEPYQAALVDKRKKRGGTSGSEEKEEEN
ncbi:hypothetical protein Naga_101734g1 [Nannochloropsis gaditana]|uniref:Uncharacterized protein n=1 Tax=Nannochloropsis gaditana TaxID=72520 RepID=W7TGP6_9STRA|nr:hypothetical protein Naga_101734g1 [Nannochloropsis gaditana]